MFKKYINLTLAAGLVLLMTACADEELGPVFTFDTVGKGAYVKLLTQSPPELDLANLGSASYTYDVEFVDIDNGNLVSQYDLTAELIDNNTDNGDDSAGPLDFKSFGSGEFTTTASGFKGIGVTITLNELLTLFNISADKLQANDRFRIRGTLTMNDGRQFAFDNSTPAVNGPAFAGHFRFDLTATCPLPDNIFVGAYTLSYEDFGDGGWDDSFEEGTVTLGTIEGSTTRRSFTTNYLVSLGGFSRTVTIEFLCDQVILPTTDASLSCADPGIVWKQGAGRSIDITNDSEIIVEYIEDTGACGRGAPTRVMKLTKQ